MDTGRSDETAGKVIPTKHMALSARSVDMVDIAFSRKFTGPARGRTKFHGLYTMIRPGL